MATSFTATKAIVINATVEKVWEALTNPEIVKQYMFGAEVVSDWKKGSPIVYKGMWDNKPYQDKGTILEIEEQKLLKSTYFSPLSGLEDIPENYNVVSYELTPLDNGTTKLTVTQTNNSSEEGAKRAEANWNMVLTTLKGLLEQ